jgi:diacylglycerol kinase (ATP)
MDTGELIPGKRAMEMRTNKTKELNTMRTILILNPGSGDSPLATNHGTFTDLHEHILRALRKQHIEPEVRYTTPEDPGTELAKQAASEGTDIVIAAGGDGTLHAVAKGLMNTPSTLGIIPIGTMNNVAHSLHIPEDIEQACAIIADGITCPIDIGMINEHIFLEVAGIGLEAAIFPAAEEVKSKDLRATLHGIISGLRTLITFRPTRFTFRFDNKRTRYFRAIQVSVCNSPYYGARFQFAPRARMNDGLLDVLIYRNFSKIQYIFHAISISQGLRQLAPRVIRRKVKTLFVDAEVPVEIHADGTPIGYTPAIITILPGVLRVRMPYKVATGPNMTRTERKRSRVYQHAAASTTIEAKPQQSAIPPQKATVIGKNTLEEKGPLHVR